MSPQRFRWLLPRLRHFYRYSPWAADRWLEEAAAECDEVQWQAVCRLLDRKDTNTMNLNLHPNEYPTHHCISRKTVSTDAIECIEQVTINVTKNTPRRFLSVYVVRDAALNYGVLDANGVGGPHTSSHEILWFEAASVEECITAFQTFLNEAYREAERMTS